MDAGQLQGKVVMVTGATSGLGEVTARALAGMAPRVYLVARNEARARATAAEITTQTGNDDIRILLGDLSSQADVRHVAAEFLATGDPLHVLCNNAGAVSKLRRQVSVDGIEMTIALNHLAYYTLTLLLLPRLRESAPARIVNVASDAYKDAKGRFPFDDYNAERKYAPIRQYGVSKLANILFTRELARRLDGTGVTANAATPPRLTGTRFAHNVHAGARIALTLWRPFSLSPEKGARPIIHLCSSPDVEGRTGMYWSGMAQPQLRDAATDDGDARRLWELSASLTGVDLPPR
jgi:NAD(P)-dependent dehydrogenase (short-subunit alcohol dehydrogenase family)